MEANQKKSMNWKKILFIFNPVAGRSLIKNYLLEIIEILSAADYKVICYPTQGHGDARRIARERRDDYLYIVCAGGDGTLDEVVAGMMENPEKPLVPIGYIPAGTTNDFASSLQIPSDMRKAAEIITMGRSFQCDLGFFNNKDYFTYVAAFGLFTGTSYQTPQELKNQLGHLAYILQGITEIGQMRAYQMHINAIAPSGSTPDKSIIKKKVTIPDEYSKCGNLADDMEYAEGEMIELEGEYALGMITNSRSIGGFQSVTVTREDLRDGMFEVTLVKMPKNPLEVSEILMSFSNANFDTQMVKTFKARDILLSCKERVSWTRDGEYAGSFMQVRITNQHRKFRILVPQDFADQPLIVMDPNN